MVTGLFHVTSRYKTSITIVLSLSVFLCVSQIFQTGVYASQWFTVSGAGILSGYSSGTGIIDDDIPSSSLPPGFTSLLIQTNPAPPSPVYGMLVSSRGQNVKLSGGASSNDPYTKDTGAILPALSIADSYTLYTPSNCTTLLKSVNLAAKNMYRLVPSSGSGVACLNSALNALNGGNPYQISGTGLAVIVAKKSGSETLNINKIVKSSVSTNRLLIITDAQVVFDNNLVSSAPTYTSDPDVQLSIVTTFNGDGITFSGSTGPLVVEGPLVASKNIILGRSLSVNTYPGVFVKYNPLYISELSRMIPNSPYKGLFESKTRWTYE